MVSRNERHGVDDNKSYRRAISELFGQFEALCEGAIGVDKHSRIAWINDPYRELLGIERIVDIVGLDVEDIIPESQLRTVVETGRPILLDIMQFGHRQFVVSRLPLLDKSGSVVGAVGFVLYDRVDQLKPLVNKFEQLQKELDHVRQELAVERRARFGFSNIVGNSAAIQEVKRLARRAAQSESPVLILGETGTGKELLAQAIHATSSRNSGPFVAVNASAIPENLVEAEFFGYVPGAFTGASTKAREGKFKLADRGTLFLDEIGDMAPQLQVKLLRVLEEQVFEPLGSDKSVRVNVRLVAATSRNLEQEMEAGRFRRDLYYRLNVLTVKVPPLRERVDDVAPLAEALLETHARNQGMLPLELTDDALALLMSYSWPGNVRELRNVLERASVACEGTQLSADKFLNVLPSLQTPFLPVNRSQSLADALACREREVIKEALAAAGGSKPVAARALRISRSRLYERLRILGLS
ncbi:sigma-54-dependent Fis family transcriptional regulator [Labrys okinawensis]|uniref:Sigma-54-dependent Fis family transcriptional regulator n=1 Tax=Labrys okinawensis TaxID=346911 RepID=A0A2S9Q3S9_9HYPH|nr:sigma 54-interacting transcriptional regulator [Labrys okinawensis]PRH84017.1 sigma-54-dependent Fis family transcriptional regulator [Labrys okinawensis]